ncbi:MAG: NAD(P)/FAD-dependent oxidoreductase [Candidatus Nanopelagicales bacterium]
MPTTSVAVVGAGQAGLAVSRLLAESGIDHVVLERGQVAERWRSQSWESLRLLSPNWLTRLPGLAYDGPDRDGFMTAAEVTNLLQAYANASSAPVIPGADVVSVRAAGRAYTVVTDAGTWRANAVVIATGWCAEATLPTSAASGPRDVEHLTPSTYRNPQQVPEGQVVVVGASASGVQIADELARTGRQVTLAAGSHIYLPRRYRGRDIMWWLEALGELNVPLDPRRDAWAARSEPSLQLVGAADGRDVGLAALQDRGIRLAGRLTAIDGRHLVFADDLNASVGRATARLRRLVRRFDAHATSLGRGAEIEPAEPVRPVWLRDRVRRLDLRADRVSTVIWATGYQRRYPWLELPVLDSAGEIKQVEGRTPAPGLHVIGMHWQTRRSSAFIHGVGHDARLVVRDIADRLGASSAEEKAA